MSTTRNNTEILEAAKRLTGMSEMADQYRLFARNLVRSGPGRIELMAKAHEIDKELIDELWEMRVICAGAPLRDPISDTADNPNLRSLSLVERMEDIERVLSTALQMAPAARTVEAEIQALRGAMERARHLASAPPSFGLPSCPPDTE